MTRDEQWLWRQLEKVMHAPASGRVACKVGTSTVKGIPDVAWCFRGRSGWLELKYLPSWPKRASTVVQVATTVEQRAFLREWAGAMGSAQVVLGVGEEMLLLPASVTEGTRAALEASAAGRYTISKEGVASLARVLMQSC